MNFQFIDFSRVFLMNLVFFLPKLNQMFSDFRRQFQKMTEFVEILIKITVKKVAENSGNAEIIHSVRMKISITSLKTAQNNGAERLHS